jgi:hypothetical protein
MKLKDFPDGKFFVRTGWESIPGGNIVLQKIQNTTGGRVVVLFDGFESTLPGRAEVRHITPEDKMRAL